MGLFSKLKNLISKKEEIKDSKEKEHRISNLKNMINHVNDDEISEIEIDSDDEEIQEDEELINYLNENNDSFEIDDEYIYRPGKDNPHVINLEDAEIDENFIIEADMKEDLNESEIINKPDGFEGEVGENFDNLINIKIGEKPIMAFVSLILGIIFIIASIIVFNARSDRIIDNVVSGENPFIMVVLILIGVLLIIYGIFKIFNIKSPFENMMESINEVEEEKESLKKVEDEEEPVLPKSNIPLDKESYKIGEFDMEELKNNLKSSFSKTIDKTKKTPKKETTTEEINVEDLPPAREKSDDKKGLIKEEIEEIDYEKAKLEGESIDEIFAEVEDLPDDKNN